MHGAVAATASAAVAWQLNTIKVHDCTNSITTVAHRIRSTLDIFHSQRRCRIRKEYEIAASALNQSLPPQVSSILELAQFNSSFADSWGC